ncbi:MAG: HAD-IIIA family hydrolase [Bacteroidetes bacterium]|nr:HAD-IIIA family hydrolase [Bacteroidota bacterium]
MIREAIVLAGGLGTRLRSAIPDTPKCLAPVAERPFLFHVINYWRTQGVEKFIFSLGYKHEQIQEYLSTYFPTLSKIEVIEEEPLGTGGALLRALRSCEQPHVLVLNGDTLFKGDLHRAARLHQEQAAACTLMLKSLEHFDRYGVVRTDAKGQVLAFLEKKPTAAGQINAGVILVDRHKLLEEELPEKFSFEKDYLEKMVGERKFMGLSQDGYFRDIGIPEDFQMADRELRPLPLRPDRIDRTWTLFLDRDGVINQEKNEDYIRDPSEFIFYKEVTETLARLSGRVGRLIIVTNQRGVGKGLMTEKDLRDINQLMLDQIEAAGGRIDRIYYCTSLDNLHPDRKPNPGMAYRARQEFPDIDPDRSLMVGNKHSDMLFGKNAGFYTCYMATTNPEFNFPHPDIDIRFDSLPEFAKWILKNKY